MLTLCCVSVARLFFPSNMLKEHCPHCGQTEALPKKSDFLKPFNEKAQCITNQVEKKSATMISLDELYHVAQTLENQALRLRDCFGLVISSQPSAPNGGQLTSEPSSDCELVGRLEEIGRCLQRTVAIHEETIELRRV